MWKILALAVAVALGGAASSGQTPSSVMQRQTVQNFKFKSTDRQEVRYLLFLPADYKRSAKKVWPLMLFLHGSGERGTNVWKVATHGPPKWLADHPDFPFILVSPQCPEGKIWSTEILLSLLDEITKKYSVDGSRIYLTGLSMGGYGTWDLGLTHPEKFAAIVPICGGGDFISLLLSSRDKPKALQTLAVWAFHGGKDPVVPLSESQRMVDFLKKAGVREVKLTIYPDAEHNSWTQTYENPELYTWLLDHRRESLK